MHSWGQLKAIQSFRFEDSEWKWSGDSSDQEVMIKKKGIPAKKDEKKTNQTWH